MKQAKQMALGVACGLFTACRVGAWTLNDLDINKVATGGAKLVKATVGISDESEAKIGRDVAAYMAARYGLSEDAEKTRYVSLVGQTLVKKCSRSDIPYHFGILKSSEINAMATPGGYVFVTEGLLNFLENEAELAGVLAHEISHVTEKHVVKAIRKANLLGAGEDLASAAGKDVNRYAQLSDFSITLLNKGLSREDELDADGKGVVLAAQSGYNPADFRFSVKRISWQKPESSALAQFNKTHPVVAERLKVIDQALRKNNIPPEEGVKLSDRYRKFIPKPS